MGWVFVGGAMDEAVYDDLSRVVLNDGNGM